MIRRETSLAGDEEGRSPRSRCQSKMFYTTSQSFIYSSHRRIKFILCAGCHVMSIHTCSSQVGVYHWSTNTCSCKRILPPIEAGICIRAYDCIVRNDLALGLVLLIPSNTSKGLKCREGRFHFSIFLSAIVSTESHSSVFIMIFRVLRSST